MSDEFAVRDRLTPLVTRGKLNQQHRRDLFQIVKMPGFDVLLDIMQMECIKAETGLINVPVHCPQAIIGEHAKTQAAWLHLTNVQKEVQRQIAEGTGIIEAGIDDLDEDSPERILDPVR